MNTLCFPAVTAPFTATLRPPGSKSITNRALVLAALAAGPSRLTGVLFADDTRRMLDCLHRLNYSTIVDEAAQTVEISGAGADIPTGSAELFCGNSGTTIRFLGALCALGRGQFALDGIPRMRQRPIGQLVDALQSLGAAIDYGAATGYPPLLVRGGLRGGTCNFADAQSSQYISAVLMVCPLAPEPTCLHLFGDITSEPYVHMTLRMMRQFGARVTLRDGRQDQGEAPYVRYVDVPANQRYAARTYAIEPDASNASYFLAAAAVCPGSQVTIENLGPDSLQGDVGIARVLHQMGAAVIYGNDFITVSYAGVLHGIDIDLNAMPDMAQTVAVAALFARGVTTIRNVGNLRLKETDRLHALQMELTKFGAIVETDHQTLTIRPPDAPRRAEVHTYDDHRMAMAFSIAALRVPGTVIHDPQCVSKTYPHFFDDLEKTVRNQFTR